MEMRTRRAPFPPWPSVVLVVGAAAYLGIRWDDIPARWVVRWSPNGTPSGWAERTPAGVFGLLVGAAALVLFVESLAATIASRNAADAAMAPVHAATKHVMRVTTFAITAVLAFGAVDLPLGPNLPPSVVLVASIGLPTLAIAVGSRRVARAMEEAREAGATKLEGYRGLYYANAKDKRLFVPKVVGVGTTINFAHPWAWPVMLLLVGLPIVAVIASLVTTQRH